MRFERNRIRVFTLIFAFILIFGLAARAQSRLLSLVPGDAEIVAGIEDPHNAAARRHMLFVTLSNTVDLDDWLSLTGVDAHREVDEVVWAAASSPNHELGEHLLLIAGRFDREHIFKSARQNGGQTLWYSGAEVLVVQPFAREQMHDRRWLAILDNRTAVFGTPPMVQEALERYATHESADARLAGGAAQLRSDVTCWNILRMSSSMYSKHLAMGQLDSPWAHLLDDAVELTIGIHTGSRTRIDFVLHAVDSDKAAAIGGALTEPRLLKTDALQAMHARLENVSVEQDRIRGSIELPGKQFELCLAQFSRPLNAANAQIAQK